MSQIAFSVRMDSNLKQEFDSLCEEFGMSMATAINIFARTVVREGRIPFEVSSHKTAPLMAADVRGCYNASPKRSASQMLRIMQALSAEAQEAGVANMSLDEINAEIDAARNGI
ncbi:MAG: type II toxin-antitoxin system RelB/DinJ family antitoxin [Fibrobacter sp.]|nr:type II toxin-antitoxin system RelB/DinJ family antitoxin [Fibrobacter sp.]